jgi:hypothetical protein
MTNKEQAEFRVEFSKIEGDHNRREFANAYNAAIHSRKAKEPMAKYTYERRVKMSNRYSASTQNGMRLAYRQAFERLGLTFQDEGFCLRGTRPRPGEIKASALSEALVGTLAPKVPRPNKVNAVNLRNRINSRLAREGDWLQRRHDGTYARVNKYTRAVLSHPVDIASLGRAIGALREYEEIG